MDEYHVAPDDAHQMFLDTVRRCFVWATLIAVVVAGVVGYAATRTVLSPLRRMADVAAGFHSSEPPPEDRAALENIFARLRERARASPNAPVPAFRHPAPK